MSVQVTMTLDEWNAKGEALFGKDRLDWKFVCPVCKHVASVRDWKDAGASDREAAFSCVGRYRSEAKRAFGNGKPDPAIGCDYAGGGLFKLNPVIVGERTYGIFAFAEPAEATQ